MTNETLCTKRFVYVEAKKVSFVILCFIALAFSAGSDAKVAKVQNSNVSYIDNEGVPFMVHSFFSKCKILMYSYRVKKRQNCVN